MSTLIFAVIIIRMFFQVIQHTVIMVNHEMLHSSHFIDLFQQFSFIRDYQQCISLYYNAMKSISSMYKNNVLLTKNI